MSNAVNQDSVLTVDGQAEGTSPPYVFCPPRPLFRPAGAGAGVPCYGILGPEWELDVVVIKKNIRPGARTLARIGEMR